MPPKKNGPVVLLTDFGNRDVYAGVLKGVIAGINPEARMIDLTHSIEPQNIRQGSFSLFCAYAWFPENSIFCAVVDPGVGSERKAICIKTRDYYFVGPDNGVLWEAASTDGIEQIIQLENHDFFLSRVSNTFHGRDLFAPVCAHISKGIRDLKILGKELATCRVYSFEDIVESHGILNLSILHVDRFGNMVLNLTLDRFAKMVENRRFVLKIGNDAVEKHYSTYAAANKNELFLINGSHPFMEISLKNGSAVQKIGMVKGDNITCQFFDK